MSKVRTCTTDSFFSGQSVCEIDYGQIKGMVLVEHGTKLDYSTLAALRTACHADLPGRAYGFPPIINWEPSGGEAQFSQIGYGPNAYNGMSPRTDALTLDAFRHYLRSQIIRNANKIWDMYLFDGRNNIYGLTDPEDEDAPMYGIPVTIYPSGNDHSGASDKASLVVNVAYQDVEEYMKRLGVEGLDYEPLTGIYGLMPVTLEKQGATTNYKVVEFYGKGDATSKYGALLCTSPTAVMNNVTAATYDAQNNVMSLTVTAETTASLKKASILCTNGIYGIEQKA